jgi:hypothetical protein
MVIATTVIPHALIVPPQLIAQPVNQLSTFSVVNASHHVELATTEIPTTPSAQPAIQLVHPVLVALSVNA